MNTDLAALANIVRDLGTLIRIDRSEHPDPYPFLTRSTRGAVRDAIATARTDSTIDAATLTDLEALLDTL